jgi:uncharacterized membrane protein
MEQRQRVNDQDSSGYDRAYHGYTPGLVGGILFTLFLLLLLTLELARIYTGSTNKNPSTSYGLYPNNLYSKRGENTNVGLNSERQHHFMWPWSSAPLLYSILVMLAAIFGFVSWRRGTYSMIYMFFTFSLLSFIVLPYIIAIFSVNINRLNNYALNWRQDV